MGSDNTKSELYIKHYKECLEEGFSELYATTFAKYYEMAILEKRTTVYAYNFADILGEFVTNQFSNKADFENDDHFKGKLEEIRKDFETREFK